MAAGESPTLREFEVRRVAALLSPDYVHALEVAAPQRWLFVSGTMGLDASGAARRALAEQLDLVWANIAAILAVGRDDASTTSCASRATCATPPTREANAAARVAALGGRAVPDDGDRRRDIWTRSWLVEIEVIAAA